MYEKKAYCNFFKLDASRKNGLSSRRRRQNGNPNHVPGWSNFIEEKENNFLGEEGD
jgi:hypothetical protein